uniref:Uncharacterized protein n=1 Tax=Anopheles atroparvus TaxID=41427 RepID=A0AAG5D7J4_ANOAO
NWVNVTIFQAAKKVNADGNPLKAATKIFPKIHLCRARKWGKHISPGEICKSSLTAQTPKARIPADRSVYGRRQQCLDHKSARDQHFVEHLCAENLRTDSNGQTRNKVNSYWIGTCLKTLHQDTRDGAEVTCTPNSARAMAGLCLNRAYDHPDGRSTCRKFPDR